MKREEMSKFGEFWSHRRSAHVFSPVFCLGLSALYASIVLSSLDLVSSFAFLASQTHQPRNTKSVSSNLLLSSSSSNDGLSGDEQQQQQQQQQQQHVVVVGGGVGGMAVAARIADQNNRVTLLEKNSGIGGRCGSFWVEKDDKRFRHEQGPSLLLLPQVYRDVFSEASSHTKSAVDYGLEMIQCSPAYQVVFDDGDRISVGFPKDEGDTTVSEEETMSRAQMDSYEAEGASKWDDYLAITEAYLDAGLPNFIEEKLDLLSLPKFLYYALKDKAQAWPLKPHSVVLDNLFESDKLKALASFQDLYVGLEPYENSNLLGGGVLRSTAPAVFGLLAAIELHPTNKNAGVFAPVGGFQAVTDAMENLLEEKGVEIRCETTVTGVTNEGVWAKANDKQGESEFIPADLVIVNADLPYAKESLLMKEGENNPPKEPIFDWDDNFDFSSGVVSFYWSLDKPLDALNTHNVFLSTKSRKEAEASWKVLREPPTLFDKDTKEEDAPFNFYVHRASKTDPSAAPEGCDAVMVLVPCRTLLRNAECAELPREKAMEEYQKQFSEQEVARIKRAVLRRFAAVESLENLEEHILDEEYRTPATWADRYNLAAGTPFALSHGFAQLSLTRPGPKSTGLSNVLYCGASTRPGNGVPLVLIGAKQVAEKAVDCLNNQISVDTE